MIRNALPAVANEMAADLQRTSYNMMIYEVRDYCTALLDTKGELISQNVGGVSHFVADLGVLVVDGMKRYGRDGFKPGDVIITNHQAVAGQHLNNVVIYMPYFYKGELLMFCMVRAHWIDVGGQSTGFGAGATVGDPWLEGLQLDQLKIYEEGKLNETLYRVIKDNIRFPESSLGDMKSQMAACRLAARRMDELFDKYGKDTILAAIAQIFDETEQKCRNVVAQLPDGVYEASGLDRRRRPDPRARRCRSAVKITIKGSDMTIDLSGCSAERKAAINSRTYAGARVAYKALTGPLDPVNEGSFRALKVIIPEGNIMMAQLSGADVGLERHRADRGRHDRARAREGDAGPRAGRPSRAARRRGGVLRDAPQDQAALHRAEHRRRRLGRPAVRGWRVGTVSVCQGDVRNGSIEGIELKCPVVVESRGAAAGFLRRRQIPRRARASTCGCATWSRAGGISSGRAAASARPGGYGADTPGEPGGNLLKLPGEKRLHNDGRRQHSGAASSAEAIVRTGGGGGWGDPLERDRRAGRRGRRGGADFGRGRAQALRRGAPRQHVARRKRDPAAARAAKIGAQGAVQAVQEAGQSGPAAKGRKQR